MSTPSFRDRLQRIDPAIWPILLAGLVLIAAVVWLVGRPLPTATPPAEPRYAEAIAALRDETAQRLSALEARPGFDATPLREQIAAAERRAATLEERLAELARDSAARPAFDPAALGQLAARDDQLAQAAARESQAREATQTQLAGRLDQMTQAVAAERAAREAALARADQAATREREAREAAQLALTQRLGAAEAALGARAQMAEAQAARLTALEQGLAARIAAAEQQIAQRGAAIEAQAARVAALEAAAQRLIALEGRSARLAAIDTARVALEAGRPIGPLADAPEALTRFATAAPPTLASLRLAFEDAARAGRQASDPSRESQGVLDSAVSRLSGLVTVRRGEEVVWGDAAGAEIERARRALEAGDIDATLRHLARLPPAAREAMRGWIGQAEALVAARAALNQLAAG